MKHWTERVALPPLAHQIVGTEALVLLNNPALRRVVPGVFALFDKPGVGKTKQVIDAAHILFWLDLIDHVLVVVPGFARSIWSHENPVLGEVAKHMWPDTPNIVGEYHADDPTITKAKRGRALTWTVTNYEFLRTGGETVRRKGYVPGERLEVLLRQIRGTRTLLVMDESWSIKSHKASQTKSCCKIRDEACRRIILNGTPASEGPLDLYAQFGALDPTILGDQNYFAFRARYARMGGWQRRQVIGYQNLERLTWLTAPYVLERTTEECLDLPGYSYSNIEAPLKPATWRLYTSMRDDLVAELTTGEVSLAAQAGVRLMRLEQLTAGYLGGLADEDGTLLDAREIGSEKLDATIKWLKATGVPDKFIMWCWFRPEIERAARRLAEVFPGWRLHVLYGGTDDAAKDAAKLDFAPGGNRDKAILVANPAAGGAGVSFAAASLDIFVSQSRSLMKREQGERRLWRPGQTQKVRHVSVIATGPDGQKTINHTTVAKLQAKVDMSLMTSAAWRRALQEE